MAETQSPGQLRKFRRTAKLTVFRTSTPAAGEDFFVRKSGGPGGETNGIDITGLRVTCTIERDLSKHPNRCDIDIYNLAPKTRAAMEVAPLTAELYAGYNDVNRLLFAGDVIHAYSKQKGPDWITTIQVADGARAYARARVNRSYRAGTPVKTILRDAARTMGHLLPSSVEDSEDLDVTIASGSVLTGATRDELTRVLLPLGYTWSVQNGRFQVLRDDETRRDVFIIDESSGMLGTPEYGKPPKSGKPPNMDIHCLLYPELLPGGLADVRTVARTANGLFKIVKVKHAIDTDGEDWFTDVELKPT